MASNEILGKLSKKDKKLVDLLGEKMKINSAVTSKACDFLFKKIGDKATRHFKMLSADTKSQACAEHIAIGMLSGDISKKDVEELLK